MRAISFTSLVAGLAVSAALAQEAADAPRSCDPKDHYDPAALAEFARERMREGDRTTAQIMFARAARILPSEPREPRAARVERRDAPAELPPAPPPIWPAK